MARWITVAGILAGGLLLAGAAAALLGARAWRRDTADAVTHLRTLAESGSAPPASIDFEDLPAPVARYFAFALPEGPPPLRAAHIRWTGEFRIRPDAAWVPFTATQHFAVRPPGFVWDATVRMLPLVPVRVRDAYGAGAASMLGRVGGLIAMVNEAGTPELAESALVRWIGEAVWFPTALLPGEGVRWEAVDDSTARVVLTDGPVSASAEFHFAPTGEVVRLSSLRYRDVEGTPVPTPFEGVYRDYAPVGGVMVPMNAEVAWLLPEGRFAYWRGAPADLRFEFDGGGAEAE